MEFLQIPHFFITGTDSELNKRFIELCCSEFNGKPDKNQNRLYHFSKNEICFTIGNNWGDIIYRQSLVIVITNDGIYHLYDKNSPHLVLNFGSTLTVGNGNGNVHMLDFCSIDKDSVISSVLYGIMFCENYSMSLHLRSSISPQVTRLLKRVYRSLDYDFRNMISMKALSDFHSKVFGVSLSRYDLSCIFQILHNGAEPLRVENFECSELSFESFIQIMQFYVDKGYGHVVFRIIKSSHFHCYFSPTTANQRLLFDDNVPQKLTDIGIRFLRCIFESFGNEYLTLDNINEEFCFSGEIPDRFSIVRQMNEENWINIWSEWSQLFPCEVARQLLALGFPKKRLYEAFDIIEKETNNYIPAILGFGLVAVGATSALYYINKNKKNMQ